MAVNARLGDVPGGAVRQRDGTLLFAAPSALPFLNGVMRERSGPGAERLLGAQPLHRANLPALPPP